jgi:cysteine desulfurase
MKDNLYLDANAHKPLSKKALQAYIDFNNHSAAYGHPSALSLPGRQAAAAIEESRAKIAELIGAEKPNQIIFTSGCSQSCDWGLKLFFNIENKSDDIAYSPLEHPAVSKICETINGIQELQCTSDGTIIAPSTQINKIICVHTQNEIGTIQPIENLDAKYIFSDMSQSIGKMPINITKLNVSIATFSAHKYGGPSGCGFMYLKNLDWHESYNQQISRYMDMPGTPNTSGIVASAVALEDAIETLPIRIEKMQAFQETLEPELLNMGFEIIGKNAKRSKGTTYFAGLTFSQKTLLDLEANGIYVGTGSACSSYSSPSVIPLMKTLGKNYRLENVLRVSQFGEYGAAEAKRLIKELKNVI